LFYSPGYEKGGIRLEKTLVKTAIYSFIASFALLLIWMDRETTISIGNGEQSFRMTPYPDFFFMILERSLIIMFFAVLIAFGISMWKRMP
jgi:hypothetical protein